MKIAKMNFLMLPVLLSALVSLKAFADDPKSGAAENNRKTEGANPAPGAQTSDTAVCVGCEARNLLNATIARVEVGESIHDGPLVTPDGNAPVSGKTGKANK